MILDTSFLVHLQRELSREDEGVASRFLLAHPEQSFAMTPTVAGELACGLSMESGERWETFLRPFELLPLTVEVSWKYGEVYRHLRSRGLLIGSNDLWIAATALAHQRPVVTRNLSEFGRVPGLEVVPF